MKYARLGLPVVAVALVGIVFYAFWLAPVAYEEPRLSAFEWLTGHWSNVSNYSHGPLIPLIASFLLWWNISHIAPARQYQLRSSLWPLASMFSSGVSRQTP